VASDGAIGDGGAAGRVDAQPSLDHAIRPVYPLGARQRGEEGTVVLDVNVAASGRASDVTLVTSSGFPALDRAAERAAAQARFTPAMRGGRPVESTARLTLVFRLRER
jgi:protein TonB